jgi:predicted PurR-regulated permease PerM
MTYLARATAVVLGTVLLFVLSLQIASVLVSVFLGLFIAIGIEPVVARAERRGLALAGLTLGGLAAAIGLLLVLVVPAANQAARLVHNLPDHLDQLTARFDHTAVSDYLARPEVQEKITKAVEALLAHVDDLLGSVFGAAGGVIGVIFSGVTVLVLAVYFSLALPRLRVRAHGWLGDSRRQEALDEAMAKVGAYVTGQAAICLCAGLASYVAMLVIGVPYPAVLAILVLLLDAIPQVGATLAAVVAVLVALTAGLPVAIATAVWFLVYQQVENYLIAPRVFSSAISVTPLGAFLAVLVGGELAGIIGAVGALPVTAAAKVFLAQALEGRAGEAASVDVGQTATSGR